jgi:hypothetical protein
MKKMKHPFSNSARNFNKHMENKNLEKEKERVKYELEIVIERFGNERSIRSQAVAL